MAIEEIDTSELRRCPYHPELKIFCGETFRGQWHSCNLDCEIYFRYSGYGAEIAAQAYYAEADHNDD